MVVNQGKRGVRQGRHRRQKQCSLGAGVRFLPKDDTWWYLYAVLQILNAPLIPSLPDRKSWLSADHMHIDPTPVGSRRLMMLTPNYLTTNQSENCSWADHTSSEPLLHSLSLAPPGWNTVLWALAHCVPLCLAKQYFSFLLHPKLCLWDLIRCQGTETRFAFRSTWVHCKKININADIYVKISFITSPIAIPNSNSLC